MSNFLKKRKSKKGLTLVEVICAMFVIMIVFVGVLNAVAFSRQMVFSNNSRESASYKGQLVADEIFSLATGCDPDSISEAELSDKLKPILENVNDPQNVEEDDKKIVGVVTYADPLPDPSAFSPDAKNSYIQYKIKAIKESDSKNEEVTEGSETHNDVREKGWDITVRVYYREISDNSPFRCVDYAIFAPFNSISD